MNKNTISDQALVKTQALDNILVTHTSKTKYREFIKRETGALVLYVTDTQMSFYGTVSEVKKALMVYCGEDEDQAKEFSIIPL